MKLLRVGSVGQEKPAMLDAAGQIRDLSALIPDFTAQHYLPNGIKALQTIDAEKLPLIHNVRIGCPLAHVGKIICTGLNYKAHIEETNANIPKEPILFLKAINSLSGPFDPVRIPHHSIKTDYEVELAIVIGKPGRYIPEKHAMEHWVGFAVINDYSEREFQLERAGQWDKGKGCDSFSPVGPYLVTADEVPDPQNLELWCEVNGEMRQKNTTAHMIFSAAHLVSYISQFMSLQTGDIICSGTPSGVGLGMNPPKYLKPGDKVRAGIEKLGVQEQLCEAEVYQYML